MWTWTSELSTREQIDVPDGMLVKQSLLGSQDAFEMLVNRYNKPLFNFICHLLGDYHLACDILQQVFLQLYISLPKLHLHEPLKAWLFQVARNRCLDELRRKRPASFADLESNTGDEEVFSLITIVDPGPVPEELAERHDLQLHLRRAIDALPPKFRVIVLLRYLGQLSFSEIGQALGIPEATAKTYFQRAKPMLRAKLEECT